MYALSAGLGAATALALREWIDWLQRLSEKRANCYHSLEEVPIYGEIKLICSKCGYQRFKEER